MGIVAAIAATDAVIPLAFGLISGERLTSVESAGLALALASVVVVAWAAERGSDSESGEHSSRAAVSIGLALVAAICFGCFVVALDASSEGSALWAVVASRTSTVALVTVAASSLWPRARARASSSWTRWPRSACGW